MYACAILGLALPAPHTRSQPGMRPRAPKSRWSEAELDVLRYLLLIYGPRGLNYKRVACLFENRTPKEVKQRCICIRDLERRKRRRALEAQAGEVDDEEPQSPTSVMYTLLPPEGQLHPEVVWVPTRMEDIGRLNL